MNVLITGAFGNVGTSLLKEFFKSDHKIRCFDIQTKKNIQNARKFKDAIDIIWGDIRNLDDVRRAVRGQDIVVHLAAIIPPQSELNPKLAEEVNVGGLKNILRSIEEESTATKIIFISSTEVFGRSQAMPPPRRVTDPVNPIEHYTKHKVVGEELVKKSFLAWSILRLSATLPVEVNWSNQTTLRQMFSLALDARVEFLHTLDAGLAIANAIVSHDIWGKTLLIGGGKKCQITMRDVVKGSLEVIGIGMLPESLFGTRGYYADWVDTTESQELLKYQRLTFQDYLRDVRAGVGLKRYLIIMLSPIIRWWIIRQGKSSTTRKVKP